MWYESGNKQVPTTAWDTVTNRHRKCPQLYVFFLFILMMKCRYGNSTCGRATDENREGKDRNKPTVVSLCSTKQKISSASCLTLSLTHILSSENQVFLCFHGNLQVLPSVTSTTALNQINRASEQDASSQFTKWKLKVVKENVGQEDEDFQAVFSRFSCDNWCVASNHFNQIWLMYVNSENRSEGWI